MSGADSGNLGNYIGVSVLKPFLNSDLILGGLVEFSIPGTQFKGQGLTTENFELILRAYVQALYETAKDLNRAYAWSYERPDGKRRFFAVLHVPPITSPRAAVQAAIVAEAKSK